VRWRYSAQNDKPAARDSTWAATRAGCNPLRGGGEAVEASQWRASGRSGATWSAIAEAEGLVGRGRGAVERRLSLRGRTKRLISLDTQSSTTTSRACLLWKFSWPSSFHWLPKAPRRRHRTRFLGTSSFSIHHGAATPSLLADETAARSSRRLATPIFHTLHHRSWLDREEAPASRCTGGRISSGISRALVPELIQRFGPVGYCGAGCHLWQDSG
jgi:hypothetical protein